MFNRWQNTNIKPKEKRYYETKFTKEASRIIHLIEYAAYRVLKEEVNVASEKINVIEEFSQFSHQDCGSFQLDVIKDKFNSYLRQRRTRLNFLEQFKPLKRLREGEQSQSWIVLNQLSKEELVMKIYLKRNISGKCLNAVNGLRRLILGHQHSNICELRNIFTPRDNPYIICCVYPHSVGGSLGNILQYLHPTDYVEFPNNIRFRKTGEVSTMDLRQIDKVSRFIVAEICYGLSYLHMEGICHANLKPENVLINEFGHIQLSDYGVSGIVNHHYLRKYYDLFKNHSTFADGLTSSSFELDNKIGKTFLSDDMTLGADTVKTVSLPCFEFQDNCNYSALYGPPEIWQCITTDTKFSHDYWSLGVLMYMCYCGGNPFLRQCHYAKENSILLQSIVQILNYKNNLYLKSQFIRDFAPDDAVDLIGSLLTDEQERFGSFSKTPISVHPYLREMDIVKLQNQVSPIFTNFKQEYRMTDRDYELWNSYAGMHPPLSDSANQYNLLDDASFSVDLTNEVIHHMTV